MPLVRFLPREVNVCPKGITFLYTLSPTLLVPYMRLALQRKLTVLWFSSSRTQQLPCRNKESVWGWGGWGRVCSMAGLFREPVAKKRMRKGRCQWESSERDDP